MDNATMHKIIEDSFRVAYSRKPNGGRKQNRQRSEAWVEALAFALRRASQDESPQAEIGTLWRHRQDRSQISAHWKDTDFPLSELLYDIVVGEIKPAAARDHKETKLPYMSRAIWIVESEFANNSRGAVLDFSKLIIGQAEHKLFVGPRLETPEDEKRYRDMLKPLAQDCCGKVYLALVPHPGAETIAGVSPSLWKWDAKKWQEV